MIAIIYHARCRGGHPLGAGPRLWLVLLASILLIVVGCFNVIQSIAAIANSRVFTANANYVFANPARLGLDHPDPGGAATAGRGGDAGR